MSVNLSINKNKYYRLRFRIHKKLQPYFEKEYIYKSLSTKNKRLAETKANKLYYPYQQILNTIDIIDIEQTQKLVNVYINETINSKKSAIKVVIEPSKLNLGQAYSKFFTWYKQQKINKKQYMLTSNRLTNILIPFLGGKSTLVENITLEMLDSLKVFLSTMPNINKKEYNGLTIEEIRKLKNVPDSDYIGIATQRKYLSVIKQFFTYLTKANLLNYNPCTLLAIPSEDNSKREPFDHNEMKQLFSIFNTLDDRKYIYYILAYTGMRPSELWKCKISTSKDGVTYFDLTDRALELKTHSSYRMIPLHQTLIDMGIEKRLPLLQIQFTQAGISKDFNKNIKPLVSKNINN